MGTRPLREPITQRPATKPENNQTQHCQVSLRYVLVWVSKYIDVGKREKFHDFPEIVQNSIEILILYVINRFKMHF